MVSKKQLAALAYGRAVRRANIKKRKTTNARYKCKSSQKKTKANFDEIMEEAEKVSGDSAPINVNGKYYDINYEDYVPKEEKSFWKKTKKFIAGAATAAALGGLGLYGLHRAGLLDWSPLQRELKKRGVTQTEINGVKQALEADTKEEQEKQKEEKKEIQKNGKFDWEMLKPQKYVDAAASAFGRWVDSKRTGWKKTNNKYNFAQRKLYDVIRRLFADPYDIDFNQLENALGIMENDTNNYELNTGWTYNLIKDRIEKLKKLRSEYNKNLASMSKMNFNSWVFEQTRSLKKLFEEYEAMINEN